MTPYERVKEITDAIYAGKIEEPIAAPFIEILADSGITLRQKDGEFVHVTWSIPTSRENAIAIGVRYVKKDGSYTEDLFVVTDGSDSVERYYRGLQEAELPEYSNTHKKQSGF